MDTPTLNMNHIVGSHDILFIVLDTLRYDVAQQLFKAGKLPVIAPHLPVSGWQKCHSPASFTYAAHHAFFSGFLPTPAVPNKQADGKPIKQERLFAMQFKGSETTGSHSYVFANHATWVEGLSAIGYQTICIGGVGFFNLQNPLGCVLPNLFDEQHWCDDFGVTAPDSTQAQVALACERLTSAELTNQRCCTFINVSALHQPNYFYLPKKNQKIANINTKTSTKIDTIESHSHAMQYVDGALAPLLEVAKKRAPTFVMICSDHGTAYGEDGFYGHRLAHEVVMTVPYGHFLL